MERDADQMSLFGSAPELPEGFRYWPDFLTQAEETDLVRQMETLPFKSFQFHGFLGKRRVVSFGWRYDFDERQLQKVSDMPAFLLPLRERAAALAGLPADSFQHALVTEYTAGAGIGWHRDKAVFDEIVGVSFLAPCAFRLRRKTDTGYDRVTVTAAARSAYLLSGPARSEWEHSIPPVDQLRYSITFRNFRGR